MHVIFYHRRRSQISSCLLQSFELQEEGNAAAVVESIRAGLVMQLKETLTAASILQRQEKIAKYVSTRVFIVLYYVNDIAVHLLIVVLYLS